MASLRMTLVLLGIKPASLRSDRSNADRRFRLRRVEAYSGADVRFIADVRGNAPRYVDQV